jgi:hypothetical protein
MTMDHNEAKGAVVTVGAVGTGGRGFVVQGARNRLVITAGHCLPAFPPCHPFSYTEERTYSKLLGPVGKEPTVWAECLFVDPIGDIAVLGPPDNQVLFEESAAYEALMEAVAVPLRIADPPKEGHASLLSLDGRWFRCRVRRHPIALQICDAAESIAGGMSGSPIVTDDGSAIGIVSTSAGPETVSGPQP